MLLALAVSACGPSANGNGNATPSPTLPGRPSSPVVIKIVEPTNGAVLDSTTLHVVISIAGGKVVQQTSTHISPTEGHVHLYLENQLVYMNYTLEQDIPNLIPGATYTLSAEWVASDHAPFSPRDTTKTLTFKVAAAA